MSDIYVNEIVREVVKIEVDKYLKEVGFPVKNEEKVGFENDDIFLLSKREYEEYKDVIPKVHCWWWLRIPGNDSISAAIVRSSGVINNDGSSVNCDGCGVRPTIRFSNYLLATDDTKCNPKIGDRIIVYDFPWIVIDKNLAIAEVPITFDKFDDKLNDYKNSYIRKFLKEWIEKRR